MKKASILFYSVLIFFSCQNLEDAKVTQRKTFMHFYEGANSLRASSAEITADGYIIAGTIAVTGDVQNQKILLIKTDRNGQKQWEKAIDGGSASSVKVLENGYIVIGDSIQYNPDTQVITELENTSSRLIHVDMNGNILRDLSFHAKTNNGHVDYHGNAITSDGGGNFITLGTYRMAGENEFAYVCALNATTFDTLWQKNYDYIARDYINSRSVFYRAGNVLWACTVSENLSNFDRSYLTIPVIQENSVFINSNYFGENSEQSIRINDLQPASLGYCAVGTYAQPDGSRANIFFIRVDKDGNFKTETLTYLDGFRSSNNEALTDPSGGQTEDDGLAVTATTDGGFVVGGSIETTPGLGNGGKDIWLIKLNAFGQPVWNKIIGGATSEVISSIRETEDRGLLICGTLQDGNEDTGGLSSIFLLKTDANGELKD